MNIGRRIKMVLDTQGKSISWLANELNTNEKTFANKLRRNSIEAIELLLIAHLLEMNLNELSSEYYLSIVENEVSSDEDLDNFIIKVYSYEELKILEGKEIPEINTSWTEDDEEIDLSIHVNGVSIKRVEKCIVIKVTKTYVTIGLYDEHENLVGRFLIKHGEKLYISDPKRMHFMNTKIRRIAKESLFDKIRIK